MESVLKSVLEDELERNIRKQALFLNEIKKYQKGSLAIVTIHGDKYIYRKSREGNKILSVYVGPLNSESHIKAIKDREQYLKLKKDIKDLIKEEINLRKAIKIYG